MLQELHAGISYKSGSVYKGRVAPDVLDLEDPAALVVRAEGRRTV